MCVTDKMGGRDGWGDCVARNVRSIRQELAVFSMVTNIELNIKTLKGLSASGVDVCVVFNVKCTLFFGIKMAQQI